MTPPNEMTRESCDPTEKTLYTEPHDAYVGTFEDRIFECGKGPWKGIGISVGGMVYVKPLKEWYRLVDGEAKWKGIAERLKKFVRHKGNCNLIQYAHNCNCGALEVLAEYERERKE